jgi:DNA gyrase subunit B
MTMNNSSYNSSQLTILPGLEGVRKNPSMYIGSTNEDGVHHLLFELIYNSFDEAIAGACSEINITIHGNGSCTVEDNGRGIPVDLHPELQMPGCELVLTRLHAGAKFGSDSYQKVTGLHGVGVSCVNALSSELAMEIKRDGHHYRQTFSKGNKTSDLKQLDKSSATGTTITFKFDQDIFPGIEKFDTQRILKKCKTMAFLRPGLQIKIKDEVTGEQYRCHYQHGMGEYLQELNEGKHILNPTPLLYKDEQLEIGLQWTSFFNENIHSFVNGVHTAFGGLHESQMKNGITLALNEYVSSKLGQNHRQFEWPEVLQGLTAVLSIKVEHPTYEGQTKSRLTGYQELEDLEGKIKDIVLEYLNKNSQQALIVIKRIEESQNIMLQSQHAGERIYRQYHEKELFEPDVYKKQFGIRSSNWHDSAVWIANDDLLSRHADMMEAEEVELALDVCCGSGVVGAAFKHKCKKIIGLDITPEMVKLSSERLDEVVQGTVYDLPFEDNKFDMVVNREVLHLLPRPEKPVSEIYRVLKPGGQFVVGQILPFSEADAPWMYRVFKKKQPLIHNMFQEQDFRELLLGAGFIDIKMTEYNLWESIDVWIDTHETTNLCRHEIRQLFHHIPKEAARVHPYRIDESGEIFDLWRWCMFSVRKPHE